MPMVSFNKEFAGCWISTNVIINCIQFNPQGSSMSHGATVPMHCTNLNARRQHLTLIPYMGKPKLTQLAGTKKIQIYLIMNHNKVSYKHPLDIPNGP